MPEVSYALPDASIPEVLLEAFHCAVAAASASRCLTATEVPDGDLLVLGAGKAAAAMACAVNAHARSSIRGLVVTRYEHGLHASETAGPIEILEAGHPLPDEASLTAGRRFLALADSIKPSETLLYLASGGGSALAIAPLDGVTLEQKRSATLHLMHAGADIREINCVRRHLSALKGGRLARAARPARVVTLAISDVPGDAIGDIGSGPTIPDPSTAEQALEILRRYNFNEFTDFEAVLADPLAESPKPEEAGFGNDQASIIASAKTALDAAGDLLAGAGYAVRQLGDDLSAEACELGREHAQLALDAAASDVPTALLSGGETRVIVRDRDGCGGRNLEYLAGLASELCGQPDIFALAADTDGIDGNADHAGGIVVPDILRLGRNAGVDISQSLAANDTFRYFDACELLLRTGPTRTNVNDFRLILINPVVQEHDRGS